MTDTTKIPDDIYTAIAELRFSTHWFQGQMNLLLAFVTSSPDNHKAFWSFVKEVANADDRPDLEAMLSVARQLVVVRGNNMSQQPPASPSTPPVRLGENVIQFPQRPKKD